VWPSGDFRTDPSHRLATGVLVGIAAAMVSVGVLVAVKRRATSLQLGVASALLGAVVFVAFGAPWFAAKALAIGSPLVLLSALVGCVGLAWPRTTPRRTPLVAGIVAGAALALGIASSNALAYHEVDLAPRAQLTELERIGEEFAGQGPALMTEYEPYGVRHFLRRLDAEGVSELRRRPIFLRDGRIAAKGQYVDLDRLQLDGLLVYRTLVLRRSPTESRPPAPYRLAWKGRWYEVWQREPGEAVLAHLPLGGQLEPGAVTSCRGVARLARLGRTEALPRPTNLIWPLGTATLPATWLQSGGAVIPGGSGTAALTIRLARAGRYRLWVGGSVRGTLTASADGARLGRVSTQLQNAGQWLDLGSTRLEAGDHRITLTLELPALRPGTGGAGFPLGPLLLQPESSTHLAAPANASALCGRTLDWVEALG
jgi:hypothetical protein